MFQKVYSQRLVIRIAQSTTRLSLIVNGEGQEPRLELSHTLVTFGPILPHGVGDEVEVVVANPTSIPVEFYSLDFDKQYLLEEKVSIASSTVCPFKMHFCIAYNTYMFFS